MKDVHVWKRLENIVILFLFCMNHIVLSRAFLVSHHTKHTVMEESKLISPIHNEYQKMKSGHTCLGMVPKQPREEMPTNMDGDFFEDYEEWKVEDSERLSKQRKEFHELLRSLVTAENQEEHWPGIVARHVDVIVSMQGFEGVNLMKEALEKAEQNGFTVEQVSDAINYIVSFIEEFVEQTKSINDAHKELLGKIIRTITNLNDVQEATAEEILDEVLESEKENFSPGFLRHLEGECNRILSAPNKTREATKLLEILRSIQARVVEELGQDLGEGALVLGQLLGYDDPTERLAVLDAGLTVRGLGFAEELRLLTQEALEGFQKLDPSQVEPDLINIISGIDDRIKSFIDKNSNSFQ